MPANRVGGPTPPEPGGKSHEQRTQAQQHRRIEKVEKVRKVDEVENEPTRKKFKRFMEEEETVVSPRAPSPFETDFYFTPKEEERASSSLEASSGLGATLNEIEEAAVASPNYAPPPNVTSPPPSTEEESPLPRSRNFWNGVDAPPDQPKRSPNFQESSRTAPWEEKTGEKKQAEKAGETVQVPGKESPFGPPAKAKGKGAFVVPEEKEKPRAPKSTGKKEFIVPKEEPFPIERRGVKEIPQKEEPTARFIRREEGPSPFAAPEKGKKKEEVSPFAAPVRKGEKKEKREAIVPPSRLEKEEKQARARIEEEGERKREKEKKFTEIESPSLPALPSNIIPLAQAATAQAAPYLSPEVLPLFYQMIGTIHVMAARGISTTEIVLNAPSFANSKFYGATITIEKYATAPDSLNIRLSGNDQAVTTFNQNIPNLYAAFQNGNFNFRIGRLDAAYSVERPVFRRREPRERKGEFGGGDFEDRRNR